MSKYGLGNDVVGVYKITNTITKKMYIGGSHRIYKRWSEHRSDLSHNRHHNNEIQNDYNKFGESSFIHEIIEITSPEILRTKEQEHLDKLLPSGLCYNINDNVRGGSNGERHHMFGKRQSIETRRKSSETRIVKGTARGNNNPMYGRKHSDETLKLISEKLKEIMPKGENCRNAKLTEQNVREIHSLLLSGYQHKKIADKFGVSVSLITRINCGRARAHLYEQIRGKKSRCD